MCGTQLFASATAFRRSHSLPPSEMKSLYGSITRSAVISLSYVTVMRLLSLSPIGRSSAAGAAVTHRRAAHNRKEAAPVGGNGLFGPVWPQFDARPRLSFT